MSSAEAWPLEGRRSVFLSLGLSLILAASGIGKLLDPPSSEALRLIGVEAPVARGAVVSAVSILELGLAVALLFGGRVRRHAASASAWLAIGGLAYLVLVSRNDGLAGGCGCFGRTWLRVTTGDEDLDIAFTVLRSCLLGWIAGRLASTVGGRAAALLSSPRAWLCVGSVALALCLAGRRAHIADSVANELAIVARSTRLGMPARFEDGVAPIGDRRAWLAPFGQRAVSVVAFTSDCPWCDDAAASWASVSERWNAVGGALRLLGFGDASEVHRFARRHGIPSDIVAVAEPDLSLALGIGSFPTAITYDAHGVAVWRSGGQPGDSVASWLTATMRSNPGLARSTLAGILKLDEAGVRLAENIGMPGVAGNGSRVEILRAPPPRAGVTGLDALCLLDSSARLSRLVPIGLFRVYGRVVDPAPALLGIVEGIAARQAFEVLGCGALLNELADALDGEIAAARARRTR